MTRDSDRPSPDSQSDSESQRPLTRTRLGPGAPAGRAVPSELEHAGAGAPGRRAAPYSGLANMTVTSDRQHHDERQTA